MLYKNPITGRWQSSASPPSISGGTYTPKVNQGDLAYPYVDTPSSIVTPTSYIPPANPANPDKPWEGSVAIAPFNYTSSVVTKGNSNNSAIFDAYMDGFENSKKEEVIITPAYAVLNPDSESFKKSYEIYGPKETSGSTGGGGDTGEKTGGGGGGTKIRYDENTGRLEVSYDGGVTWETLVDLGKDYYSSSGNAQFAYNAQLKAIEEQRKYQEQLAEQARQDAIKNAYITYDRSLPTFGQNAERLAQMGLTNSGYSDYLGGVAYSSMVGGVQDAHKTANKAIQDAYYNAELQKAQAADTLYKRQLQEEQIRAAERAEQAQLLASVYSAVSKGDMSSEVANTILQTYGIGSTANGGNVDNTGNGGTPADTDISDNTDIPGTIKNVAEEQAYNNLVSQITAAMTDADIDALTDNLETRDKLKADRDKKIVSDEKQKIVEEAKSGNVSLGNIVKIDTLYEKEKIDINVYQGIYFDKAVSFAQGIENIDEYKEVIEQIDGYVNQGKMTTENAETVKNYIANTFAHLVPEAVASKIEYNKLTIEDKQYYIFDILKNKPTEDKDIADIVERCLDGKTGFVAIGDDVYYKMGNIGIYRVINRVSNKILDSVGAYTNTTVSPIYTHIKE